MSSTPFPVTLFHNPACSNARGALTLLREHGIEPVIVEYLKKPPSAERLAAMGMAPRELLRSKEAVHAELGLDDPARSNAELIDAMVRHPQLMNRPIVETPRGTRLCRPPQRVLELLPPQRRRARRLSAGTPTSRRCRCSP